MTELVTLTAAAGTRIAKLTAQRPGECLRLTVGSSGCSGYKYDLGYAAAPGPHDERAEAEGGVLYVDPMALVLISGTRIDWVEDRMQQGFTFDNPNETGRCGCGESFAA